MKKSKKKTGRSFEKLIEHLERVVSEHPDATIEAPKKFIDKKTRRKRQHDVVITTKTGHHVLTIAIECRDRSIKIGSPQVEGFWAKCLDTGVNQGIIVSPKGFAKPALQKAQHYGIRCLTIGEALKFNWLLLQSLTLFNCAIKHTNWTLLPEQALSKPLEGYKIVDKDGKEVKVDVLNNNAYSKLRDQYPLSENLGLNKKRLIFDGKGIYLEDKETAERVGLKNLIADVDYEITSTLAPFSLIRYSDQTSVVSHKRLVLL